MGSFVSVCPSCGYELRGARSSDAVKEFALRLEKSQSHEQQILLIRNFPVPNTKEDIFEFMILASTNIVGDGQKEIAAAWIAKFEQSYQKAKLTFGSDSDFSKFQNIYDKTSKQISRTKNIQTAKKVGSAVSKSIPMLPRIIVVGWLISIFILIPLCGQNLDNVGFNSFQLLLMIDLIAGAVVLPAIIRCDSSVPGLITVIGMVISITVLIPLCGKNVDNVGTNAYQLILIVDIIVTVVILLRSFKKKGV